MRHWRAIYLYSQTAASLGSEVLKQCCHNSKYYGASTYLPKHHGLAGVDCFYFYFPCRM